MIQEQRALGMKRQTEAIEKSKESTLAMTGDGDEKRVSQSMTRDHRDERLTDWMARPGVHRVDEHEEDTRSNIQYISRLVPMRGDRSTCSCKKRSKFAGAGSSSKLL
jgi:hypothetical protein